MTEAIGRSTSSKRGSTKLEEKVDDVATVIRILNEDLRNGELKPNGPDPDSAPAIG